MGWGNDQHPTLTDILYTGIYGTTIRDWQLKYERDTRWDIGTEVFSLLYAF